MEKGKLIVFEGLDGAGTTTQMKLLGKVYEDRKRKVFITHEPTDNAIGKVVRSALRKEFSTTASSLALLYASDRDDHLYNSEYGMEKYLEDGYTVISDRYFYSSIAYQGVELDFDYVLSSTRAFLMPMSSFISTLPSRTQWPESKKEVKRRSFSRRRST